MNERIEQLKQGMINATLEHWLKRKKQEGFKYLAKDNSSLGFIYRNRPRKVYKGYWIDIERFAYIPPKLMENSTFDPTVIYDFSELGEEKNEIKIGDIVEIVDDEYSVFEKRVLLTKGKLAEVIEVGKHANNILVKELVNPTIIYGRDDWWISKSKVKKVEEQPTIRGFREGKIPQTLSKHRLECMNTAFNSPSYIQHYEGKQWKSIYNAVIPPLFSLIDMNVNKSISTKDIKLVYINDKKRQVCIKWGDGTTTKATCSKKDEFDINIGFAIAFTRKFFKSDRVLDKFLDKKLVKNKKKKEKE